MKEAAALRLRLLLLACFALAAPALSAAAAADNGAARYLRSLAAPSDAAAPQRIDPAAQRLAEAVADRYGAKLLSARPADADGRAVYEIVVMRPGGDFDDAYAVETLTVDATTGELVPQFRSEESGYRLSAPPDRRPRDNAVSTTIRRESFRKPD